MPMTTKANSTIANQIPNAMSNGENTTSHVQATAPANFYQMMIRNGIATQNDLRKLEDMAPIADKSADIAWISKDLFPSESQMKASTETIQATEKTSKGGEANGKDGTTEVPDDQTGKQNEHTRDVYRRRDRN